MKKNSLLKFAFGVTFWVLCYSFLHAGGEQQAIGGRRISLGGAYAGIRGDYWSLNANPSGLFGIESMQAGVFVERRFLLNQMNHGNAGFALPFMERHAAGISFGGFGFGGYSDSQIGFTYAAKVIDQIHLGARINYKRTSIANYGSAGALVVDAGLNAMLSKGLTFGFCVYNANQARLNRELFEQIPTTLEMGLAYQASDKVLIVADLQKQINFPYSFRGGVEYALIPTLKARIGVSTQPVTLNAGLGLDWKGLLVDWSNSYHEYLGYTPALSISYRFGNKPQEKP